MKYNRWFVIVGALLIQVSLGAIYIYSVFKPALKEHFPSWSATDLALPSQAVLAFFALSMIVSGRIQDKIGPKKTAIAGAIFLILGMFVAAKAETLFQFVMGFGVLAGIGIGAAYVCPIATCVKWFPDKRGLVAGLAVAGFGAGGLVFAPLATYLIASVGIMAALFYLGLIYFFAIIAGSLLMRVPVAGYCPSGWTAPVVAINQKIDFTVKEMIKTRKFWILWSTYFIGCTAGLLVIMNLANIWQSMAGRAFPNIWTTVPESVFRDIMSAGALAVMAVSVLNSLGRIVWGKVSDKAGREKTLATIFLFCGVALLLLNSLSNFSAFVIGVSTIGFCFGGLLALYPVITADYFGSKNIGANYGLMFSAYGAGGLLGPWLAPKLVTDAQTWLVSGAATSKTIEIGSYANSFIFAGFLCLIAAFLITRLKSVK